MCASECRGEHGHVGELSGCDTHAPRREGFVLLFIMGSLCGHDWLVSSLK